MLPNDAEISGRTRILGLIADPVVQARSPGLANSLLEQRGGSGSSCCYMRVPADVLGEVVAGLRQASRS